MTGRNVLTAARWSAVFPVLVLWVLCLPSTASAAGNTTVSVSAPTQPVAAGGQFTVGIALVPDTAMAGMQFDLSFDASLVAVSAVQEGDLLNQGGATSYFNSGTIDNDAGKITGVFGAITTPGMTVSTPGTFATITFTAKTQSGTCPLSLSNVVVGDIDGNSVSVTVVDGSVTMVDGTVSIDQAPVLNTIGNKSVNEGATLSITISASDADGDALTYSASNLPVDAAFNAATQTFSWTPSTSQAGAYTGVRFQVSDGQMTDYEDITITVIDEVAPVNTIDNQSIDEGATPDNEGLTGATAQGPVFRWWVLSVIIGGALVLIAATVAGVLFRRRQMVRALQAAGNLEPTMQMSSKTSGPQQEVAKTRDSVTQRPRLSRCPVCRSTTFHVVEEAGSRRCSNCHTVLPSYVQGNE